jgi:hypothetical protein
MMIQQLALVARDDRVLRFGAVLAQRATYFEVAISQEFNKKAHQEHILSTCSLVSTLSHSSEKAATAQHLPRSLERLLLQAPARLQLLMPDLQPGT